MDLVNVFHKCAVCLEEAQYRWLCPAEICQILTNQTNFQIASEPSYMPPSSSLLLFDRKVTRYFRKDGHNWRKQKDGKTVREAHERLKVLVHGQTGEEVKLELILRVVADVGLIGLPNAGKSTLLAAITLAKPDIASYPFTTLMQNLGRLAGDPNLGTGMYSSEATLADLPGLIEGTHLGKGLGRKFLRHLRRTRLLVHVVDASNKNTVNDYRTVREELRMYNPKYLERPYIVVLNKIDLPEVIDRLPTLTQEIQRIGSDGAASEPKPSSEVSAQLLSDENDTKEKTLEDYPRHHSVIGVSVM
ncbi:probable GTP-binding protein OBGC2 isoform X2 [Trifolium pratense]|uniref:probable GTP-binding protein OBGC2 isoform X2 n=1 Tax=Trifolium pratense TaxID=57577 RepID=UPI001E694D6F|nr:probable GTP-binding protein OBGC2 isoform X2 [Trifolium pratense]